MKQLFAAAATAAALLVLPASANAALVFDSSISTTGQGFGNHPRLLTVDAHGASSGCVTVGGTGGTLVGGTGACDGTLYANLGGNEANPLSDNQKFGIPTIGELGWTSAADIGLLFNPVEPGNANKSGIDVDDVTLKFYNGTSLIAQINGSHSFPTTSDQGNGNAGLVFVADAGSQAYLAQAIFGLQDYGDFRIALESSLSNADGGPDSWSAVNLERTPPSVGVVPEPATWAMMLLGFGGMGALLRSRRRQARSALA